jgi:hypothetical protein
MPRKKLKNKKWLFISIGFIVFIVVNGRYLNASDAYIRAKEEGQGISLSAGSSCYVITAFHVVEDATNIVLIAPDRSEAKAELIEQLGGVLDIGVLRVAGNSTQICKENKWFFISDLSKKIEEAGLIGNLKLRKDNGSRQSFRVVITDYNENDYIKIRPLSENDPITKGMSGGLLVVNGIPAGVLTEVNPNNGEGTVLRNDYLYGFLRKYIEAHRLIGRVEELGNKYVIIELNTEVLVGTKIYALTPSGRKIMLKVVKVSFEYARAQFLNVTLPLKKGDPIYEFN